MGLYYHVQGLWAYGKKISNANIKESTCFSIDSFSSSNSLILISCNVSHKIIRLSLSSKVEFFFLYLSSN